MYKPALRAASLHYDPQRQFGSGSTVVETAFWPTPKGLPNNQEGLNECKAVSQAKKLALIRFLQRAREPLLKILKQNPFKNEKVLEKEAAIREAELAIKYQGIRFQISFLRRSLRIQIIISFLADDLTETANPSSGQSRFEASISKYFLTIYFIHESEPRRPRISLKIICAYWKSDCAFISHK
ncbi:hypothetical protein O181_086170 [Austropuccinia psidii MF-1]|uniref:Uncharacterized protein n=1 Tax=Austropuccinia psidii MF-1 TaxID=1389203 RepID=A0A9Q3FYU9_9BASI|nr:hypothetical protein [Austropuccinia psidii MF-1]